MKYAIPDNTGFKGGNYAKESAWPAHMHLLFCLLQQGFSGGEDFYMFAHPVLFWLRIRQKPLDGKMACVEISST
jgi:hypothetical protein